MGVLLVGGEEVDLVKADEGGKGPGVEAGVGGLAVLGPRADPELGGQEETEGSRVDGVPAGELFPADLESVCIQAELRVF